MLAPVGTIFEKFIDCAPLPGMDNSSDLGHAIVKRSQGFIHHLIGIVLELEDLAEVLP